MPTKLDQLLESIDQKNTLDKLAARADKALNSFKRKSASVKEIDEFEDFMAKFHCHLMNNVLNLKPPRSVEKIDWDLCRDLLSKEYGGRGHMVAFEMAETGAEGGLYGVLKSVAKRMADHYANNAISVSVAEYWNDLSTKERLAAIDEYLEKYGHLYAPDTIGGVKVLFSEALKKHPYLIREFREAVR